MMNKKRILVLLLIGCGELSLHASLSLVRPYDTYMIPALRDHRRCALSVVNMGGVQTLARGEHGTTNSMQIWQHSQNALAMLNGFPSNSPIGMLDTLIDATDNGTRGHFIPTGDLKLNYAGIFAAQFRLYQDFVIGLYLPVYATELINVNWCNQTQSLNAQDARVNEYLTQNFAQIVQTLGGLDIGPWKRAGIGDFVASIGWSSNFPQQKPFLKNVYIALYLGLGFPTGKLEDYDKLLAFSYGNDGSWGIPFGLGLELLLSPQLSLGADIQLAVIFGNTRDRRIKTAYPQTDLLLLQKAPVYRDPGLDQCFNLYAQAHMPYGFSLMFGYQYCKHGEDTYAVKGNTFSSTIANSAERLQDWTAHFWITELNYTYNRNSKQWAIPEASLFIRAPFNGRRSIMSMAVGVGLTVDF